MVDARKAKGTHQSVTKVYMQGTHSDDVMKFLDPATPCGTQVRLGLIYVCVWGGGGGGVQRRWY